MCAHSCEIEHNKQHEQQKKKSIDSKRIIFLFLFLIPR